MKHVDRDFNSQPATQSIMASSTASATSTVSNTLSVFTSAPSAISPVSDDCPGSNRQIYTSQSPARFTKFCSVNWSQGSTGANQNGTVHDLLAIYAFSLNTCIEACSDFNMKKGFSNCLAVSWSTNAILDIDYGNCWLKDRVGDGGAGAVNSSSAALLLA